MLRRRITSGDEADCYAARKFYFWRAGEVKMVKRRTHKRERREGRVEARTWDEG